jgi:hypothetical protein
MMTALTLSWVMAFGMPQGGKAAAPAPAAKDVMLKRVYKLDEKQGYTFEMTMGSGDGDLKIEGGFNWSAVKLDGAGADILIETTKLRVSFNGQGEDAPDLPKPLTLKFDEFGMPTKIDLDEDSNPAIGLMVACYLPNKGVALGGTYPIKWESSDGYKLDGTGTLIATGRLYEEHVSKIQFEAKTTEKSGGEGKISGTLYANLDTGKLVKAEGTAEFESGGEKSTGKMVIAKVRQK